MMDPLLALTVKATFLLVALVAALVAALLILKIALIARDQYAERARRRLAPLFERYILGLSVLPKVRFPLRPILQYVIIYRSFGESDAALERMRQAYARLRFDERDRRRLKSVFWWVRAEGARCLGQMKCGAAKADLLRGLRDSVLEVRLLSAWALGRLGDPDTLPPIIAALAKHSRVAAMRLSSTVFELGAQAIDPLIGLLKNGDPAVRLLVVHLLGELKSTKALPKIAALAGADPDKEVRVACYKALGGLADRSLLPLFMDGLRDPIWEIRAQAARGLGLLPSRQAVDPLAQALGDPEWWVRRNAGQALTLHGAEGRKALSAAARLKDKPMTQEIAVQWLDELESLP